MEPETIIPGTCEGAIVMSESDDICSICGVRFKKGDTKELFNGKWQHFRHSVDEKLKARILDVENAKHSATYIIDAYLANLGNVVWDHRGEIIAALEKQQAHKESHVVNHLS